MFDRARPGASRLRWSQADRDNHYRAVLAEQLPAGDGLEVVNL